MTGRSTRSRRSFASCRWNTPRAAGSSSMRRTLTTMLALTAATWSMCALADVSVMAVRLGAKDVVALAKFYDAAFGLKEIDRVGQPPTEIIMRYGTSVAAAKAGSSPEFLLA